MGQNEMIFYIVAAGCMICLMIGIVRNILSIGTGALLGLPGIIALYAAAVFLLQ